jgi:Restriction Enzyme Adenine Methylase Associated
MAQAEVFPFTVLVPDAPGEAIELIDRNHALRLAFVHRDFIARLSDQWDTSGIYILLEPVAADGTWGAYVGKAGQVKTRLLRHTKEKDGWLRALLVVSNQREPFHTAEIGWLEGQVHSLLVNSYYAQPSNRQNPGDETVAAWDQASLWTIARGVTHALRLLGYETAEEAEIAAIERSPRTRANSSKVSLADLFQRDLLRGGERLVSLNGQWPAEATAQAPGEIIYNGEHFSSPSAAASAVREGGAANGWAFWGVVREGQPVPLAVLRAELDAQ